MDRLRNVPCRCGADALELENILAANRKEYQYGALEQRHIDILSSVKKHVSIPVISNWELTYQTPLR